MNHYSILLIVFLLSTLLTGLVRYFAQKHALLDIPNERSSHERPTPRSGGIAMVLSFSLAIAYLLYQQLIPLTLASALLAGGAIIAVIGYLDDHLGHIAPYWRILVHISAAIIALICLGGFEEFHLGVVSIHLGMLGTVSAVFGIVWLTNLYNFMDGIDGLAAGQGVMTSLFAGIALAMVGEWSMAWICFFLAAAIAGFYLWNFPPAKIFMGDVGSGWIGFTLAVLMIATAKSQALSLAFWLMLLMLFICDATFTLLRRMKKGEKWYSAHRSHAYQQLVQRGFSHLQVSLGYLSLDLLLLMPLAYLLLFKPSLTPFLLGFSLLFCWFLWRRSTK